VTTPTWKPLQKAVTSITVANPGVATTSTAHGYSDGLIVRFEFFDNYGMFQVLGNQYTITVLTPTTFSLNASTLGFDPFVISSTTQTPQVVPVGEIATTLQNLEQNTLTPTGGFQ
jgi:hypothetical protein